MEDGAENVEISWDEGFSMNENHAVLEIPSVGNAAHIFVNGRLTASVAGDYQDRIAKVKQPIELQTGSNQIAILSMTVGLQTGVRAGHMQALGIQGSIMVTGLKNQVLNLSSQAWMHQVGLKGENRSIYSETGSQRVNWTSDLVLPQSHPLIWYKTEFDSTPGDSPMALDLIAMGKGQAWVNGRSLGRYWPFYYTSSGNCSSASRAINDRYKCGQPSQRWYHIPRSWLKPTGNLLVLFEEVGGDPRGIRLVSRWVGSICSSIAENYPPPLSMWPFEGKSAMPELTLECEESKEISLIRFASFGTPSGRCGNFRQGACHAPTSRDVVEKVAGLHPWQKLLTSLCMYFCVKRMKER